MTAKEGTKLATSKGEITEPASRAIVHEDTLLLAVITLSHDEIDVLKRCSLCNLPMDARSSCGLSKVHDKVADLSEEVVLVDVPVGAAILVWIAVEDCHALEVRGRLDGRLRDSVTNQLSVVVHDDWLADPICARGEVDHGREDRGGVAEISTAIATRDGEVDGIGVVSHAVTFGSELGICDIAENLV